MKSASPWAGNFVLCPSFSACEMGNRYTFTGMVLTGAMSPVGYLHLRLPLSFSHVCLSKVLENTEDFFILV